MATMTVINCSDLMMAILVALFLLLNASVQTLGNNQYDSKPPVEPKKNYSESPVEPHKYNMTAPAPAPELEPGCQITGQICTDYGRARCCPEYDCIESKEFVSLSFCTPRIIPIVPEGKLPEKLCREERQTCINYRHYRCCEGKNLSCILSEGIGIGVCAPVGTMPPKADECQELHNLCHPGIYDCCEQYECILEKIAGHEDLPPGVGLCIPHVKKTIKKILRH